MRWSNSQFKKELKLQILFLLLIFPISDVFFYSLKVKLKLKKTFLSQKIPIPVINK